MKNRIKLVIAFVLGAIIFGSIGVYASAYVANQITYTPANSAFSVTSVAGAIDNLYEYAQKSATNAERMNKPNTWPVDEVIDFGDGVYGYRKKGTLTVAKGANSSIILVAPGYDIDIINYGGWFNTIGNGKVGLGSMEDNGYPNGILYWQNEIRFFSKYTANRTDEPYDVWVLYTKAN